MRTVVLPEMFKGAFQCVGIEYKDGHIEYFKLQPGTSSCDLLENPPPSVQFVVDFPKDYKSKLPDAPTEDEMYPLVRDALTVLTAKLLKYPMFQSSLVHWLSGTGNVIHTILRRSKIDEPDAAHTLIYASRQWLAVPGIHGKADYTYDLDMPAALEYARRMLVAVEKNTWMAWLSFAEWYRAQQAAMIQNNRGELQDWAKYFESAGL